MKKFKRVLVGLLAVAMLASGMVFASFATDDDVDSGVALPDYADVVKFYDPLYSKLYDDESFDDGAYDGVVDIMANAAAYTGVGLVGDSDKHLAISFGHILNPDARTNAMYSVDFEGDVLSKVVFRAAISASHEAVSGKVCPDCIYSTDDLSVAVCPLCSSALQQVSSEAPTVVFSVVDESGLSAPLLIFDFATSTVNYMDGPSVSVVDGLSISENSWYDVEIVCDSTQYKFKITSGESVFTVSAVNSSSYSMSKVAVGARFVDDVRNATIMIDDVFVQAGIDDRNTGVDLYAETAEGLALINSLLRDETLSVDVKNDVIAVFDTLTNVYAAELALNEAGTESVSLINEAMLAFFTAQLKLATDSIDVSAPYATRLALIEGNAYYAERISALLATAPSADAEALIVEYNTEKDALAALAARSEEFITYINGVMASDPTLFSTHDYSRLKTFVDQTRLQFNDEDGDPVYDSTYLPIKDALSSYNAVAIRYNSNLENSATFCECVQKAKLAEEDMLRPESERVLSDEEFMESLAAYETAKRINFTDVSYPGISTAVVDFAGLTNVARIASVAERFIANVETAERSLYIFKKEEWLDAAEPDYELADERFEGVVEAKALYDELRAEIAASKAAAEAYIAAVNAIEGKEGDAFIEAINAALALKDAGNIQGYDGVAAANMKLDNIHKSYQLEVAYAEKFITLVAAIADAETLEERFVAISLASEARGYANDSIDGVLAANDTLVAAITQYNADITNINNANDAVASNAAELSAAATALDNITKLVASVIKAIVD